MFRALRAFFYRVFVPHRHTVGEFVRFGIVGMTNTAVDFGIYIGLTRTFVFWERHYLGANAIAFGCAVTSSFLFNNFWTFRKDGRDWHLRSAKFVTVCVAALGLHSAIVFFLTAAGTYDLAAKFAATVAVALWNFTMYKMWAFRG